MQGFVAVGGVLLILLFGRFAQVARAAHRVAEWAVERGSIFGGIRHDARVDVSCVFQRNADGGDAPVHHVGWGDHLRACFGVAKRLFDQHFYRFIVEHIACGIG